MTTTIKDIGSTLLIAMSLGACAAAVPKELADARGAYDRASHGTTAQLAPADLHKGKSALDEAERAFDDEPEAQKTRDLAYVALRKIELAEVMASRSTEADTKAKAEQDLDKAQAEKQRETTGALTQAQTDLASSQAAGAKTQADLAASQAATAAADARTKDMAAKLASLAAVKEEERGLVVTLSGSVLFRSNKYELLPEAQTRLNDVSDALLSAKERTVTVEGYTDSQGSDSVNLALSQRRAESVRTYLVSRGYESDRITARGMGEANPVADNGNAEGRANNRRVEIILAPAK